MDPVADKLLIIAALLALVSLDRLAAWVAMVIIAREFAVTVTRLYATQQGVVIAANWWGKAKTIVQVAAIFFAHRVRPDAALGRRARLRRGGHHRHLRHRLLLRAAPPAARGRGAPAQEAIREPRRMTSAADEEERPVSTAAIRVAVARDDRRRAGRDRRGGSTSCSTTAIPVPADALACVRDADAAR